MTSIATTKLHTVEKISSLERMKTPKVLQSLFVYYDKMKLYTQLLKRKENL